MGSKEKLSAKEQLERDQHVAQGKLLLSQLREGVAQGDVSKRAVALMEHLAVTNLELADVESSSDDLVVQLHLGINAMIAEILCEIAYAGKERQKAIAACNADTVQTLDSCIVESLRRAYQLTQSLTGAKGWFESLMGTIAARKQEQDSKKLLAKMLKGGSLDPEAAAAEFSDPFAVLHDAAQDPTLDAALLRQGFVAANRPGESSLARLHEMERAAKAGQGEGAKPSSSRSIHDAGTFQITSQEDTDSEQVIDLDLEDEVIELIELRSDGDSSVVRALTERPPSLPSERLQA